MYIYYKYLCSLSCTSLIVYMFTIVYNIIRSRETANRVPVSQTPQQETHIMTNPSRVLPGFSCLCVLSFGLYVGTAKNCIVLWCWRAHKTVSPRKIFLDHFVSCICTLVVFIWCLWCLLRFRFNAKRCGISCKYPINSSLFLSNMPVFLSHNGIRNAQVVGSSPTTSSKV